MEMVVEYRTLAAQLRREAQIAALPNVRGVKLAAADKWEAMAREIETMIAPSLKAHVQAYIY